MSFFLVLVCPTIYLQAKFFATYQSNKEIFSGSKGSEIHSTYASDFKYLLEDMHQLRHELIDNSGFSRSISFPSHWVLAAPKSGLHMDYLLSDRFCLGRASLVPWSLKQTFPFHLCSFPTCEECIFQALSFTLEVQKKLLVVPNDRLKQ